MDMIQTELSSGRKRIITWLMRDSRVKVGSVISFEKGGEQWRVEKQYTAIDSDCIQRGWGLDLPKSYRTER